MSDLVISCVIRLPGLYAWLLGSSVLRVWAKRVKSKQIGVDIRETHVGPGYRHCNVRLFKLVAIRIQVGNPVIIKAVIDSGNNGLYDLLLSCWIKLGIGGDDEMGIMSWDGDPSRGDHPGCPDFRLVHLLWSLNALVFMLLSGILFTLFLWCASVH